MPTEVRNNAEAHRYELVLDGNLIGVADYRDTGSALDFPHTEIVSELRGQGFGADLVRGALDDVRRHGRAVIPTCWYVAQFIDENPSYRDLVA